MVEFDDKNGVLVISFHDDGQRYMVDGKFDPHTKIEPPKFLMQCYAMIAKIYDFSQTIDEIRLASSCSLTLTELRDSVPVHEWKITEAHPTSFNFGDLSYSSDPAIDVVISWSFKKCVHTPLVAQIQTSEQ